jgi:hypothetical protein
MASSSNDRFVSEREGSSLVAEVGADMAPTNVCQGVTLSSLAAKRVVR